MVEAPARAVAEIRVLPNLEVVRKGGSLNLPARAQRLIALLAVTGGSISRSAAAERLWPDVVNARACASLRATLWGLARGPWSPVVVDNDTLALDSSVESQLESADALAMSVLDGSHVPVDTTCAERLSHDLLPDWADEWLVHERERYRQCGCTRSISSASSMPVPAASHWRSWRGWPACRADIGMVTDARGEIVISDPADGIYDFAVFAGGTPHRVSVRITPIDTRITTVVA